MKRTLLRQLPTEPKQALVQDQTAAAVTPPEPLRPTPTPTPTPTPSVHVDVDLGSDATELTDSEWSAFVGLD